MLSCKLPLVGCRSLLFLSKHKAFLSMSSSVNKLLSEADKPSTSRTLVSNNFNASKGQRFKIDGGTKNETESRPSSTRSLMADKVELEKLSDEEKEIYFAHKEACEEKICTKILLQGMQYLLKYFTDKEVLVVEMPADIVLLIMRMFHSAKELQNSIQHFTFNKSQEYILDEAALSLKATMPSADQMNAVDKNSICAGCGTRIIERFYLMAVDRAWHIDCLKCSECDLRLDNELTCFSKDGLILCRDDYYKRFSVQKCSACSQGITSKELVMRAREHVYHIGCFACDRCKRMLATGEYFGMRGMRIYCKEDYEEVLREESRSGKTSSSSKGRPRKRRLATTIESVNALSGFTLGARPEDLNGVTSDGRPKRVRTSFKHHQLRAMKAYFAINHNPDAKDLKQLSQKTGLTKRVLQVWFQNARAKFRRTVCNSQSPMSPSCEQLTPTSTIVETPGA